MKKKENKKKKSKKKIIFIILGVIIALVLGFILWYVNLYVHPKVENKIDPNMTTTETTWGDKYAKYIEKNEMNNINNDSIDIYDAYFYDSDLKDDNNIPTMVTIIRNKDNLSTENYYTYNVYNIEKDEVVKDATLNCKAYITTELFYNILTKEYDWFVRFTDDFSIHKFIALDNVKNLDSVEIFNRNDLGYLNDDKNDVVSKLNDKYIYIDRKEYFPLATLKHYDDYGTLYYALYRGIESYNKSGVSISKSDKEYVKKFIVKIDEDKVAKEEAAKKAEEEAIKKAQEEAEKAKNEALTGGINLEGHFIKYGYYESFDWIEGESIVLKPNGQCLVNGKPCTYTISSRDFSQDTTVSSSVHQCIKISNYGCYMAYSDDTFGDGDIVAYKFSHR